jgi:hypothetical protein
MNPFLEQEEVWPDFHHRLIDRLAEALADQVDPGYLVKIEEQLYVQEAPGEPHGAGPRADVASKPGGEGLAATWAPGRLAVLEAPARIHLPWLETEHAAYLEIRDRASRELVTVLELLSPTNKVRHRDQYLRKRDRIFVSPAHLVEIDLLRSGEPMPAPDRPDCAYSVMVSRAERRPKADFWPVPLRSPLPLIPVPLRARTATRPSTSRPSCTESTTWAATRITCMKAAPNRPCARMTNPGRVRWPRIQWAMALTGFPPRVDTQFPPLVK